jgi:hypothetical protein
LKTLEASRACVRADFEDSNLIHGLFEAGAQVSIKHGAEWVITSCEPKLLHLYKKLGFKDQKRNFSLKTMNNLPHIFIAASTLVVATSKGLNPIIWHFSYRPVAKFLESTGFLPEVKLSFWKKFVYHAGLKILKFIGNKKT